MLSWAILWTLTFLFPIPSDGRRDCKLQAKKIKLEEQVFFSCIQSLLQPSKDSVICGTDIAKSDTKKSIQCSIIRTLPRSEIEVASFAITIINLKWCRSANIITVTLYNGYAYFAYQCTFSDYCKDSFSNYRNFLINSKEMILRMKSLLISTATTPNSESKADDWEVLRIPNLLRDEHAAWFVFKHVFGGDVLSAVAILISIVVASDFEMQ